MKKFTLLIAMGILMSFIGSTSAIGQNMALNPSYEDWTVNGAGGPADNWTLSSGSMTGAQPVLIVQILPGLPLLP